MQTRLIYSLVVWLVVGVVSAGQAHTLTTTHNNSTIEVDPHSVFGLSAWTVEGTNHLFEQWYWFRMGGAAFESSLDTLPLLQDEAVGNQIRLAYSDGILGVDILYTLVGGANGSGLSTLEETITLTNHGGVPLALTWFMETDLDLNEVPGGDMAFGGRAGITQAKDGTIAVVTALPAPNAFRIVASPFLFDSLTDDGLTNLDNTGSPFGPGDASIGFQWNFTIPATESVNLTITKAIVPEPGTLVLLGSGLTGLLAYAWRRQKRAASHSPGFSGNASSLPEAS